MNKKFWLGIMAGVMVLAACAVPPLPPPTAVSRVAIVTDVPVPVVMGASYTNCVEFLRRSVVVTLDGIVDNQCPVRTATISLRNGIGVNSDDGMVGNWLYVTKFAQFPSQVIFNDTLAVEIGETVAISLDGRLVPWFVVTDVDWLDGEVDLALLVDSGLESSLRLDRRGMIDPQNAVIRFSHSTSGFEVGHIMRLAMAQCVKLDEKSESSEITSVEFNRVGIDYRQFFIGDPLEMGFPGQGVGTLLTTNVIKNEFYAFWTHSNLAPECAVG